MTRTTLLVSIIFLTGIPSDAGAASVPATFVTPAAPGTPCAPLTWQSLYPWSHCHEWSHQVYGNGWGLPYFSIGFGGSGFAPIFPWGAYWGLDVRFLPVGWGHQHGPHLAGTQCAYRGDCVDRGVRPPAKSFTIERPPTRTADDDGSVPSAAPALLFKSGASWEDGIQPNAIGGRRSAPTTARGGAQVDDVPPPDRWTLPGGGDDPTRIIPAPGSSRSAAAVPAPSAGTGNPGIVTLGPPISRRLDSEQRARPPSSTIHRVYSASGSSTLTGAQSRNRVRAIDRAVNQWRNQSSGRRSSVFGSRSVRKGDYPSRGSAGTSRGVRSKTGRGSAGAPPRERKGSGEKGATKVRTGGGGD